MGVAPVAAVAVGVWYMYTLSCLALQGASVIGGPRCKNGMGGASDPSWKVLPAEDKGRID